MRTIIHPAIMVDGRGGSIKVDVYSDTHLGNRQVAEDMLRDDISQTIDHGNYWMHLGDAIEGILPNDRRFDPHNVTDWAVEGWRESRIIECQWERMRHHFGRLDPTKCLAFLCGDGKHDAKAQVADVRRSTLDAMGLLGVDGGVAAFMRMRFKRGEASGTKTITGLLHHGWFAGRKKGGKVNNLVDGFLKWDADYILCGHGHTPLAVAHTPIGLSPHGKIEQHKRWAAMAGTYLKTYEHNVTGYGEVAGYDPTSLGVIQLVIRPFASDTRKRLEIRL